VVCQRQDEVIEVWPMQRAMAFVSAGLAAGLLTACSSGKPDSYLHESSGIPIVFSDERIGGTGEYGEYRPTAQTCESIKQHLDEFPDAAADPKIFNPFMACSVVNQ